MNYALDPQASMLAAGQPGFMPAVQPAAPAPVPADPNTAARAHAISQLAAALSAPAHQNAANAPLSAADRKREWLNFGLNLIRAGGDWHNGLLSSIGAAGTATLADVDRIKKQRADAASADRQSRLKGLGALADYYGGERKFAASRTDAKAKQKLGQDKLAEKSAADKARAATDAAVAASQGNYRQGQLANAAARLKETAKTGAARRKLLGAQAKAAQAKTTQSQASGPAPLKDDQVRLRNGNRPYSMAQIIKEYHADYPPSMDPLTGQTIPNPKAPPFQQYLKTRVTDATNPNLAPVNLAPSGLDLLRQQAARDNANAQHLGTAPYDVPVPLRGGTNYSGLWK